VSGDQLEIEDVVTGVPNIAEEIRPRFVGRKLSERQVRYWLERGILPAGRVGSLWAASRRRLHKRIDEIVSGK
jgi:hypothetical protein